MMTIRFDVLGEPTGKGRPKVVRRGNLPYPVAITPDKTRAAEQSLLAQALAHKPAEPLCGPLTMRIDAICGIPPSWPKRRRTEALTGLKRPTGKPDIDNLAKLVLDALNGVFYLDDKQVVTLQVTKTYGPVPKVRIEIAEDAPALTASGLVLTG